MACKKMLLMHRDMRSTNSVLPGVQQAFLFPTTWLETPEVPLMQLSRGQTVKYRCSRVGLFLNIRN